MQVNGVFQRMLFAGTLINKKRTKPEENACPVCIAEEGKLRGTVQDVLLAAWFESLFFCNGK
jgi:hypothetical protein